jgi:outer membrane biosynthesis protein TonB
VCVFVVSVRGVVLNVEFVSSKVRFVFAELSLPLCGLHFCLSLDGFSVSHASPHCHTRDALPAPVTSDTHVRHRARSVSHTGCCFVSPHSRLFPLLPTPNQSVASALTDEQIIATARTILKQDFSASTRLQALVSFLSTNSAAQGVWARQGDQSTLRELCAGFASAEERAEAEGNPTRSCSSRLDIIGATSFSTDKHEDKQGEQEEEEHGEQEEEDGEDGEAEDGAEEEENQENPENKENQGNPENQEAEEAEEAREENEQDDESEPMLMSEDENHAQEEEANGAQLCDAQQPQRCDSPSTSGAGALTSQPGDQFITYDQVIHMPVGMATVEYPGLFEFGG